MAGGVETHRDAIAAMGHVLGPDMLAAVHALYRDEQEHLAAELPIGHADLAYGPDPRHRLDLYMPDAAPGRAPILLWVHGGGFLRGEKRAQGHPFNAHAGRWAARAGLVGAVMNYRLAPDSTWPAGGEDVGSAIAWLREHAEEYGGDPQRIVAIGTSAGAAHVATWLRLAGEETGLAGAVLLSGLYGFTPLDARDEIYYGPQSDYAARMPRDAIVRTDLPLFVACAEFDPPRFQAEALGLLSARLAAHGAMPRAQIAAGHNHFSLAYHLGTADTRVSDVILDFIASL